MCRAAPSSSQGCTQEASRSIILKLALRFYNNTTKYGMRGCEEISRDVTVERTYGKAVQELTAQGQVEDRVRVVVAVARVVHNMLSDGVEQPDKALAGAVGGHSLG